VTTYEVDVADRDAVLAHADDVRRDLGPASMVFNNPTGAPPRRCLASSVRATSDSWRTLRD